MVSSPQKELTLPQTGLSEMVYGAGRLLSECLQVKNDEALTIVADSRQDRNLVDAFMLAGRMAGLDVSVAIYATRGAPQEEPSSAVAAAMKASDAYVLIPTRSIVYTDAQRVARASGARLLVCSGLKPEVLTEVVPYIDYEEMATIGQDLMGALDQTQEIRITSPEGTDFTVPVSGRPHFVHDGVSNRPGEEDDIPGGGAFVIPDENSANGRFVFNASLIPPCGNLSAPVTVDVAEGRIAAIEGGIEAERFRTWIESFGDPKMYHVVELAFGLNRASYVTGSVAGQDESVYGMVHIGIGSNVAFGGTLDAKSHADGMLSGANVWFDDRMIITNGDYSYGASSRVGEANETER